MFLLVVCVVAHIHCSGITVSSSLLLTDKLTFFLFRIVCEVGPMNEPQQGQIEVNINGKLGKSPSEVLFTYQVSAFFQRPVLYFMCDKS